jgi:hypothetical protein
MSDSKKTTNFKEQLNSHYLEQHLSVAQLQKLQQLKSSRKKSNSHRYIASTCALVCISILYLSFFHSHDNHISKQIAYNHSIKLQMEVLSPDYKIVQNHLSKLGFKLVSSAKIDTKEWKLIGGRYCNINGKVAAQLKVHHAKTDSEYTFYQAKLSADDIDQITDNEIYVDGVKVRLWREKGLLMGLAF